MGYAVGVTIAIAQLAVFHWVAVRVPLVAVILGYLGGLMLLVVGIAMARNPYVGEIHRELVLAVAIGLVFWLVASLMYGGKFWQSAGIVGFGVTLLLPVNLLITFTRDKLSATLFAQAESQSRWHQFCDSVQIAFAAAWLLLLLLAPTVIRAAATKYSVPHR